MKFTSSLLSSSAVAAVAILSVHSCDGLAITRRLPSFFKRSLIKRDIYDVPEVNITGLNWNATSSVPSIDLSAGTASVEGDLNVYVNFSETDDAVTYDSLQVQGYYVFTGNDLPFNENNKTQIACGSLEGPINVNSSQPLLVPLTLQVSNLSLNHPILVDVAALCLGAGGAGELTTIWGGWLQATVEDETYRCPLPITNLTLPCPSTLGGPLQSPGGAEGNGTCLIEAEAPLPANATETSASPSESATTEPASSPAATEGSSTTAPASTESPASEPTPGETSPAAEPTTATESVTTPPPAETETDSSATTTTTPTETVTGEPTTTTTTPTETATDSTTSTTTIVPTITSVPTTAVTSADGSVVTPVPVIVTVTETATSTAAARRRAFF